MARFIKIVKTTQSELDTHESRVNAYVKKITEQNGKVVTITHTPFGISPMYLICTIVYERDTEITN